MTKFLSFAVIVFQNLSQLMCGHFAVTNQNDRNKQGSRKNLVTIYLDCLQSAFSLQSINQSTTLFKCLIF